MTEPGDRLPPSAAMVQPGQTLADKYLVTRPLGSGGMGAVFEAKHTFLRRRFAIKLLHPELTKSAHMVARFRREAQAAGQLEHENVASVTDYGVTPEGAPYLVMEFLEGEDLGRLLQREGPLVVPRAASLVIQACRGISAAHAAGIVHRDLKPENLFVCPRSDGTELVKVLDFGVAKIRATAAEDCVITKTGAAMGTPHYMSPEQARGDPEIDYATDVYALGAVLYEVLSSSKAHPGATYNEIIYHILTQQPAPLGDLRPDLPCGLVAVVERAMATEREHRFPSVAGFGDALRPFTGRGSGQAVLETSSPRSAQGSGPTLASPVSLGDQRPPQAVAPPSSDRARAESVASSSSREQVRHRGRKGLGIALGALGAVVALATFGQWRGGHSVRDSASVLPATPSISGTFAPAPGRSAVTDQRTSIGASSSEPPLSDSRRPPAATGRLLDGQRARPERAVGATPSAGREPPRATEASSSPQPHRVDATAKPGASAPTRYDRENPY